MAERGFDHATPIEVLYVDHAFFIAEGHLRAAAAVRNGLDLVPCLIVASEDEPFDRGPSAREHVRAAIAKSLIDQWEVAVGFRYEYEIGKE